MNNTSIDFGTFPRPQTGEVGRLVLEFYRGGMEFSLNHMVTPHEGTILATGRFERHVSPDLAEAAIKQIIQSIKAV